MCCSASIFNMTAIAVDRYIATTYPLKYRAHASNGKAILAGVVAWIAAAIATIPEIFAFGKEDVDPDDKTEAFCQASTDPA